MNQNPEQLARDEIDKQLLACGWIIQHKNQINFSAGIGVAVREYQTDVGPADYVLFVNKQPVGIIEAKRSEEGVRLTMHEDQTEGYATAKDMKSKLIHDTIDKITLDTIENSSTKLISKGSILFVVGSGILRRTLPTAITICDVTVNQDLQALTPKEVLSDYVYWYVQSKNEDIRKHCGKDGTTVESIESSLLKNYLIPVCSKKSKTKSFRKLKAALV